MFSEWNKPIVGRTAYLIRGNSVVEVVVTRSVSYSASFKKDEALPQLTAGVKKDDAHDEYVVGLFKDDGAWEVRAAGIEDLFESPREAFDALRNRNEEIKL